jgi:hypothetical protein
MKHDVLRSVAHNIADSLASGCGLLIGVYDMDVFGEAHSSPEGFLDVDFLSGTTSGATPSSSLAKAIKLYQAALPDLCASQGAQLSDFKELVVKYFGRRFSVMIVDQAGRQSTTEYESIPGQRVKVLDTLGRLRPAGIAKASR